MKFATHATRVQHARCNTKTWHKCAIRYTLLHWSASNNYSKLCLHFLHLRADPDAKDMYGKTALAYAREHGHKDTARITKPRDPATMF